MNQCVPSWDLDDAGAAAHRAVSGGVAFTPAILPLSDQYYEVAELTWEKGSISSHGLLNHRPVPKYPPPPPPPSAHLQATIGSAGAGRGDRNHETLEAVVGEAAARSSAYLAPPVPVVPAPCLAAAAPVDALVPCARDEADGEARPRKNSKRARVAASQGSAAPGRGESTLLTLGAADDICAFTATTNNSTSLDRDEEEEEDDDKGSPETENTSIGGGASDSRCFSRRSQRDRDRDGLCDEGDNVVMKGEAAMRSSISTKRSRAAAIHNESERKRRDRINQKMKTLQKLVPNSSKTDKASMLDEVIEHLKQLQAQVQVMSRMSSMMMPAMTMPQLQMSVMANMAHMAQMAQMGLGIMNMGHLTQPGYGGLAPMMHPSPFAPMSWDAADRQQQQPAGPAVPDAFSAFLACQAAQQNAQQQPAPAPASSVEAYNKMVALYQKMTSSS